MPSVFLSHNAKDKPFARRLKQDLERNGVKVWFDEAELNIGDSLMEKIGQALDETDYIAVVLSRNSITSRWVQKELGVAMQKELNTRDVVVLPILLDESITIPPFLRDKKYANFAPGSDYDKALSLVLRKLAEAKVVDERRSNLVRIAVLEYKEKKERKKETLRLKRDDLEDLWENRTAIPFDADSIKVILHTCQLNNIQAANWVKEYPTWSILALDELLDEEGDDTWVCKELLDIDQYQLTLSLWKKLDRKHTTSIFVSESIINGFLKYNEIENAINTFIRLIRDKGIRESNISLLANKLAKASEHSQHALLELAKSDLWRGYRRSIAQALLDTSLRQKAQEIINDIEKDEREELEKEKRIKELEKQREMLPCDQGGKHQYDMTRFDGPVNIGGEKWMIRTWTCNKCGHSYKEEVGVEW